METYVIRDAQAGDRPFAFEIENAYVAAGTIVELLGRVDGVTGVLPRRPLHDSADVHIVFKYRDRDYMVWEPYGDSSRYWIGPQERVHRAGDISDIENVFRTTARHSTGGLWETWCLSDGSHVFGVDQKIAGSPPEPPC